jgi:Rod binding domain-containing protein
MSAAVDTSVAMAALRGQPIGMPHATSDPAIADKTSKAFEGMFVTQMLGQMFSGIPTDGPFGGGPGEEMFRSLMVDEYGKQLEAQGGLGLSDSVKRELLKMQENGH